MCDILLKKTFRLNDNKIESESLCAYNELMLLETQDERKCGEQRLSGTCLQRHANSRSGEHLNQKYYNNNAYGNAHSFPSRQNRMKHLGHAKPKPSKRYNSRLIVFSKRLCT